MYTVVCHDGSWHTSSGKNCFDQQIVPSPSSTFFSCFLDEPEYYSETTTSSEPSESEDDEEYTALEREYTYLMLEEEELLAIGKFVFSSVLLLSVPALHLC